MQKYHCKVKLNQRFHFLFGIICYAEEANLQKSLLREFYNSNANYSKANYSKQVLKALLNLKIVIVISKVSGKIKMKEIKHILKLKIYDPLITAVQMKVLTKFSNFNARFHMTEINRN